MLIYAVGAAAHGMVIQYENIMPVHNQIGKLHAEANQIVIYSMLYTTASVGKTTE